MSEPTTGFVKRHKSCRNQPRYLLNATNRDVWRQEEWGNANLSFIQAQRTKHNVQVSSLHGHSYLHLVILTPVYSSYVTQQPRCNTWLRPNLGDSLASSGASTRKVSRIQGLMYHLLITYDYYIPCLGWAHCACRLHRPLPVSMTLRGRHALLSKGHATGTYWSLRWIYLSAWWPSVNWFDKHSQPAMPTGTASTSCISYSEACRTIAWSLISMLHAIATNPTFSQFNLVNYSSMSDDPPVRGERMTGSLPNEAQTTTNNPALVRRTLSFFTLYDELSAACTQEEFVPVRVRLQQEWSFNGGLVSQFTAVLLDSELIYHSTYRS